LILDTNAMIVPSCEHSKRHDNDIFKREQENAARVECHYLRDDVHQIGLLRKLFRLTGSVLFAQPLIIVCNNVLQMIAACRSVCAA